MSSAYESSSGSIPYSFELTLCLAATRVPCLGDRVADAGVFVLSNLLKGKRLILKDCDSRRKLLSFFPPDSLLTS